jgi:hypothetical protein
MAGVCRAETGATKGAEQPAGDFPLGVYWPWERTAGCAKRAGLERWEFVKQTCDLLKSSGVDAIWFVNIDLQDTKEVLQITRAAGIKIVPCLGEIEVRNRPQTAKVVPDDPQSMEQAVGYYRKTVPQVMQMLGDDRQGILAWVLGDEPSGNTLALVEPMRKIFAEADPDHPLMTVSMWPQTPTLIEKTRLTTFCVDLYPFFGPNDPNGPHTPASSANFFTSNTQRIVEAAGKDGRVGWVMPQCFNEIWGPWELREDGVSVALPGSYNHWRTPTESEMRWQTWETLRCGAKGVFFFVLLAQSEGNPQAKPVDDASLKDIVLKTPTVVGYDALLDFRGRPTPQFNTLAQLYRKLSPHKPLLRRLVPSADAWLTADAGAQVGCFVDPTDQGRYAFVVNADMAAEKTVHVSPASSVAGLVDVLENRPLGWDSSASTTDARRATVALDAGSGVFLRAR